MALAARRQIDGEKERQSGRQTETHLLPSQEYLHRNTTKLLKNHSNAKCTWAPAYSQALRRIKVVSKCIQSFVSSGSIFKESEETVGGDE